jgi:hypothetical protein
MALCCFMSTVPALGTTVRIQTAVTEPRWCDFNAHVMLQQQIATVLLLPGNFILLQTP